MSNEKLGVPVLKGPLIQEKAPKRSELKQVKKIKGDNALQKAMNFNSARMPFSQDTTTQPHQQKGVQASTLTNQLDPAEIQRRTELRSHRVKEQLKDKERANIRTRYETSDQMKVQDGFNTGVQKSDRVSGIGVLNNQKGRTK